MRKYERMDSKYMQTVYFIYTSWMQSIIHVQYLLKKEMVWLDSATTLFLSSLNVKCSGLLCFPSLSPDTVITGLSQVLKVREWKENISPKVSEESTISFVHFCLPRNFGHLAVSPTHTLTQNTHVQKKKKSLRLPSFSAKVKCVVLHYFRSPVTPKIFLLQQLASH